MRGFSGGNAHGAPCRWEWILKYFIIYVCFFPTSVFSLESVLSTKASAVQQDYCWNKYDDVASRAYAAPVVVRAFCMVIYSRGNLAQFNATFYVNRVLKAEERYKKMLEGSPKIDLNFGMDEDQFEFRSEFEELEQNTLEGQTCLIPRVDLMKEYLLFLRPVAHKPAVEDQDNEVEIEEEEERTGWSIFAAPEISSVASIGHALKVFAQAKRPSITKLRSTNVKLDERLSLLCRVKGFPPPKILWYKNGVNLESPPSRRGLSIRRRKRTSTLRIRKASNQDAGVYRCVAVNILGSSESQANVSVITPPTSPPVMTLNPVTESWVFKGIDCPEREFCLNGGVCKYYPRLSARSCKCPLGYHGTRCEGTLSLSEEKFYLEVRKRKRFEGPRCELGAVTPPIVIPITHDTSSGVFEVYVYTISAILVVLLLAILIYSFRTYRLLSTAAANPYSRRDGSLYFRQQSTNSAHSNAVPQFQVVPQPKRSTVSVQNGLMPHVGRDEKLSLLPTSRKPSEAVSVLRQSEVPESQTQAEVPDKSADTSRWKKYQWLGFGPTSEEPLRPHPSRPVLEGSFSPTPPRPSTSSFQRPAASFVTSDDRQL